MSARLTRGMRVGDRYRLERELGGGTPAPGAQTWEAVDERLDRSVALRIFDGALDRQTIVARAGKAASLTHPRVVRVFDTGEDAGRFFTVSEYVGESLQTVRLPLASDRALQLATDLAEALDYAHERGIVHGNLTEANVLLSEGGAKIGDFALSRSGEHADRDDDLRSLGALMRRVAQLPNASAAPGFTRVVEGLASGAYTSAAEVLRELREMRPAPARPSPPARGGRSWLLIAGAVLIAAIAFGVMQLGEQTPGHELIPSGRIEGDPLPVASVDDLDPPPGDNDERPGAVGNAVDGDPATFWSTERYSGSPDFNGRKDGVGLIFDLGAAKEVGQAEIQWTAQGCGFELLHSDTPSAPVDEWGEAAEPIPESPVSAAMRFDTVEARYWLLWITKLAPAGSGFQCGVRQARLFAPQDD